jgi:hypothetical protein
MISDEAIQELHGCVAPSEHDARATIDQLVTRNDKLEAVEAILKSYDAELIKSQRVCLTVVERIRKVVDGP